MERGEYNKRKLGAEWETRVTEFLIENGYQIIARNFFCRQGELDIIAKNEGYLTFIEVKYRKNERFGNPAEAVTPTKQKRMRMAARVFLYQKHYPEDTPCRFDVVGVLNDSIKLIQNAFS